MRSLPSRTLRLRELVGSGGADRRRRPGRLVHVREHGPPVPLRDRHGRDRDRPLRVRRQLRRPVVRAHQLRRRRRVRGGAHLAPGGAEAVRGQPGSLSVDRRSAGRECSYARHRRGRRRAVRVPRRHPAHASLGAGRRHRHVRRARDHPQRAAELGSDRPGRDAPSRRSPRRRASGRRLSGRSPSR